jgi:hypothetical protein
MWVELFIRENGGLHIINYTISTEVEGKDKLFVVKWDSIRKHVGSKKTLKNMGFNVKKRIGFIPKFVSMPRIKEHLLLITKTLLMPNWHMGW